MFPHAYFPPTYFPGSYFNHPGGAPPGPTGPNSYFGGSYFPKSYFPQAYFPQTGGGSTPPPPASLTDNLGLMYQQVVDELTSTNLFKTKAVFLSLLTDPFPSADYPQVVVRPGACQPIEGQLLGGGRYTAGVRGSFKVILWTRNATDLAYQDTNLLTAQTRGALWLANNIVDLLLELFPTFPATGLPITEDGLKFGGYDEPERWKDPKDTRDHRSLDAGGIVTTWHFTVRLSLTGAP